MFIRCTDCKWRQPEFWSKDGAPFSDDVIDWWKGLLFQESVQVGRKYVQEALEIGFEMEYEEVGREEFVKVSVQDILSLILMITARDIKRMRVKTLEEWKQVREGFVCPNCGSDNVILYQGG